MSKFFNVINEYAAESGIQIIVVPLAAEKHLRILNYVKSNTEKDINEQLLPILANCISVNDMEQYLVDNGYTADDLAKMYKSLYYEI